MWFSCDLLHHVLMLWSISYGLPLYNSLGVCIYVQSASPSDSYRYNFNTAAFCRDCLWCAVVIPEVTRGDHSTATATHNRNQNVSWLNGHINRNDAIFDIYIFGNNIDCGLIHHFLLHRRLLSFFTWIQVSIYQPHWSVRCNNWFHLE